MNNKHNSISKEDEILGYAEAARFLNIPIGTLDCWVHNKRIPHIRIGRRAIKFVRSQLCEWLEQHQVQPSKDTTERRR